MRDRRRLRALVLVALITATIGCSDSSSDGSRAATTSTASTTSTTTLPPLPASSVSAPPGAGVTQPAQTTSGPGGSALPHRDWRESSGGSGADAWYVFEPTAPQPDEAPLAIVMHGYGEFEGYGTMYELVRHTVLSGSVVIYPRWQTGIAEPCPGPFDADPCLAAAVTAIEGALAHLGADDSRVQPDLDRTSYYGFSFGGILTANMTNRWEALGLPEPRAIFIDDMHDGGLDGLGEPALDDSMAGIPSDVLLECHVGAQGVIAEDPTGGCNALFPRLDHIPTSNKAIVLTRPDDHGEPALSSAHGVCAAQEGQADAYDWGFCWKVWDALRAAVDEGGSPRYAIGDDPEHTDIGVWSDGTPIAPLEVRHAAPIGP
ncbi:MAG TPA: hypothetical protein VK507_02725 [Iamia sp.]|nr:hypothetical protein [Iamia sp.]